MYVLMVTPSHWFPPETGSLSLYFLLSPPLSLFLPSFPSRSPVLTLQPSYWPLSILFDQSEGDGGQSLQNIETGDAA